MEVRLTDSSAVTLFPFTVYINYACLHKFNHFGPDWISKTGYYVGRDLIDYSVEQGGITKEQSAPGYLFWAERLFDSLIGAEITEIVDYKHCGKRKIQAKYLSFKGLDGN